MRGVFNVGVCVSSIALALMMASSARVETQSSFAAEAALTATATIAANASDAPAGFEVESNGFAEQYCAHQKALSNSPNSTEIPDDECSFEAAVEEFTGPGSSTAHRSSSIPAGR